MGIRVESQPVAQPLHALHEELSAPEAEAAAAAITGKNTGTRTSPREAGGASRPSGDVVSKRSDAAALLNTLGRAADAHKRARRHRTTPFMPPGHAKKTAIQKGVEYGAEQGLHHVAEHGAKQALRKAAGAASAALAGLSAGMLALEGLQLGLEQIIGAHEKGHQFGIRDKAATGLGHVLKLATKHPEMSVGQLREQVRSLARRDYTSALAGIKLLHGGKATAKELRELKAEFEGYRKGMEAGLKMVAKLSSAQRRALGGAAMQRSGKKTVDAALERLSREATGADSIHAGTR